MKINSVKTKPSDLGHLKKIISFSSSWLRNLNAAGGNLIVSICCASYIRGVGEGGARGAIAPPLLKAGSINLANILLGYSS